LVLTGTGILAGRNLFTEKKETAVILAGGNLFTEKGKPTNNLGPQEVKNHSAQRVSTLLLVLLFFHIMLTVGFILWLNCSSLKAVFLEWKG